MFVIKEIINYVENKFYQHKLLQVIKSSHNSVAPSGVNFINILLEALMRADPKRAKNTVKPSIFSALLGSAHVKALSKMLLKLTPGDERK